MDRDISEARKCHRTAMADPFALPTSQPTLQPLRIKTDRDISETRKRHQTASNDPLALPTSRPGLILPEDTFFAPQFTNPHYCIVCSTPFTSQSEVCQHIEISHPTIYHPSRAEDSRTRNIPFADASPIFPLSRLRVSSPNRDKFTKMTPEALTPISVPPSGKPSTEYLCDICDIGCGTMELLNAHLAGHKHRKKVEIHDAFLNIAHTLQGEGISELNPRLWVCRICPTLLDGEGAVLRHLEASKHKLLSQENFSTNEHANLLQTFPDIALQAAEPIASTPVSTALAVLNDVNPVTNAPLPPASSPFTSPFPTTSGYNTRRTQTTSFAGPTIAQSSQPGARRLFVSKNPRPLRTDSSNRQSPTTFTCLACSVKCNSVAALNDHLASALHERNQNMDWTANNPAATLKFAPSQKIQCEVCDVKICGKPNFEAHLKGKQHKRKMRMLNERNESILPSALRK